MHQDTVGPIGTSPYAVTHISFFGVGTYGFPLESPRVSDEKWKKKIMVWGAGYVVLA